ncbi:phosphoribosylanthranilate isomerase [Komarekiella sp. 'clone 1']|uniref:N-(5'-phosphoribosyl)anthranilate isomerase n=1 Tax=Komarekiella delphini-convector SJRDD-AB1 TaxID=2593771 RepID=A0AA40VTH0_9NOST|nr:phosphoribosylanthranilate isomerase [Komarekiella delphini-convector]MBD6618451.1 phosphoribosylanthranilate isomerase [Komarekiella delphini-convector SJRDD-AB1]
MEKTAIPRVKICCISSTEEAWTAIRYGASALGLVSYMPSGPGVISEELITKIAACVPPPIATFLLTSSQDAQEIIQQVRNCRTNTVQICDYLKSGSYQDIRAALPGISIVQVIHVTTEESLKEAISVAPHVDAILLDSGNQSLLVKELGGTGRLHDWNLSAKIRQQVDVPIFLAGGLKPENVAIAVKQVAPFGLDLCSAVRSNGKLDEYKLKLFFQQLKYCTEEVSLEFN